MKKLTLLTLVCMMSAIPLFAQTGIELGANVNSLEDVKINNAQQTFEDANGWHIGVFVNIGNKFLLFRPGVRYTDGEGFYKDIIRGDVGFKVSAIEVPLDFRFRINTPIIKPYLVAGPLLRFPVAADDQEFQDALENFNLAASVGGGVELKLGGLHLYPEINVIRGVTKYIKNDFQIGGINFNLSEDSKINTFVIKLGVAFN